MTEALPHTTVRRERPPSAVESGVRATSANWIDAPFNRWGYSHVRDLTRTATVGRGGDPVWAIPASPIDLDQVVTQYDGESYTYTEMLHATYTDACVVIHDGQLVFEYCDVGIAPEQTHLLMSVSKSLTATLIGVLVEQGLVATEACVTDYIAELVGTSWEGCTVQHLLDMRGGVAFTEHDMDDPDCDGVVLEQVSGYTSGVRQGLPANTYDWIRSLPNQQPHGGPFVYRSILIDVLGWIAEEVTGERFADQFSRLVWSRIGAEHAADLIQDSAGFPIVEGGFCTTARDLARFGLMHLQRGNVAGEQVVPGEWIDRVTHRDQELIDTFAVGYSADPDNPEAYYHDCWWVRNAALGRYGGYGLGGQTLLIDRTSNTVVVKLSSWPKRIDPHLASFADAANEALFDWLRSAD
ncbi:MAG: beta-lactamase family protein [Actinomycetia bacterium]|nr:beta-lactamase family protein [Actinomycetes bacterium]